ncbi:hypothetical protein LSH36_23g07000 [Paralvinella palmiformis]|uniref:VWFC domain-containing protein n=1 Tax=Paralvinella palmiformis TaxID=53620 RepID=A0AAD9KAS8_9ANNE|nr:hypothetical protein LSH36_23g07000 [Paralvinella palmiformis]
MTAEDYISIDITAETGQLLYWNTEHDDPESYDVTPAPRVVNSKMAQAALGYCPKPTFPLIPSLFIFQATMSGIPDKVSKIIMTTMSRAKKPFCEISGNSMRFNKHSLQYTGKGKCKRLPISAVSSLLRHQVAISVFTAADEKAVVAEGSISEILYNGNIEEVSDDPVLLVNNEINPSIIPLPVGLAWLTLSELCQLHYQVMGSEAELPDYLYSALHQGDARLVVFSTYKNVSQLSGQLRIKNRCNRQQARDKAIETKKLPVLDPDTVQDDPGVVSPIERQCMTDGNVYQDMDTWPDKPGSCKICSCKRKVVECHDVLCPNLTDCRTPVHIEGECCPQCKARDEVILTTDNKAVVRMYVYRNMYTHNNNNNNYYYYYCMIHLFPDLVDTSASCYYPGDKRKHFRGAIWHPYVPPFGFMPCAVCQCSERSGEVNCTRVMCPELTCPEEKAFLKSKTDCCKVCPEMIQGDIDEEGACMFRGHKHYNGTSWHPNVQPFGVMKCITCSCICPDEVMPSIAARSSK